MKYAEVMKILKEGGTLKYYSNGFVGGMTVSVENKDEDSSEQLHPNTYNKIFREHKHKFVPYGMQGNEEAGFIDFMS